MFDYQARLIFMSVVYHGIAHRTDITTLLNSKGVRLPELDVWGYCDAYPERFQSRNLQKRSVIYDLKPPTIACERRPNTML